MIHELKILPEYFNAVISGEKTFEICKNDRPFHKGDLNEYGKNSRQLYAWHISNLVIYDKPKELSEFVGLRKTKFGYEPIKIERPPQSWMYCEEV